MRMYFDSDKAWKFLFDHDYVFTLRVLPKVAPEVVQEVEIWRNKNRTEFVGRKVPVWFFSVFNEGKPHAENFAGFVEYSGFKNWEEWWAEAERLSGKHEDWVVYYVEVGAK